MLPDITEAIALTQLSRDEVVWLQQCLIAGGYLPSGSDDGIVGPKTSAAFAKFKGDRYLLHPGLIGPGSIPMLEDLRLAQPKEGDRRRINQAGLDLIKEFEGVKLQAYKCPAGVPTIGYGSTVGVKMGDRISLSEAEVLLAKDLERFEDAVSKLVSVSLTDNQFAALVSFAFNVGASALARSTLLKRLNRGDYTTAANELLKWDRAGRKRLPGLTRRRQAERSLFLS